MEQASLLNGTSSTAAHVLIVEDDQVVRNFCTRLLRLKGYVVHAVDHGLAALHFLEQHTVDLVITDLQMPQMDGISLLHAIRERETDTEVVVFTAYATVETARDALKLGAFDYLTKPVSIDDLERTVRRAIEWRRSQREKRRLSEIVALYTISEAFTGTLETSVAVREIVDLLSRYFAPHHLSLSLFHPEDRDLELLAVMIDQQPQPVGLRLSLPSDPDEDTILATHRMLTGDTEQAESTHLVSLVLRTIERPVGVLRLMRVTDQPGFEERDRTLLAICASQIAASLDNSRLYHQQKELYLQTIRAFAALIDARDPYTRGHSEAVMHYAVRLAEAVGMCQDQLERVRIGALLHDIGKIGVRDDVLRKPGRLTDQEMDEMKAHPRIGADILRHIKSLWPVIPMVEQHHERLDGRGYPDGLVGDAITPEGRLLAIADSFDAMTSDRAYRRGMPVEVALADLVRCRGSQLDPTYVDVFVAIVERDPDEFMAFRRSMQS